MKDTPLTAFRKLEIEGWQMWPNDKIPNTDENLEKYDFISCYTILYFKIKEIP